MRYLVYIFVLVALGACSVNGPLEQEIDKDWKFEETGIRGNTDKNDVRSFPASVPGCVHLDLLDNGMIEDPFYAENEAGQQWIGKTGWTYYTSFEPDPLVLERDNISLRFEGLDTYASVFLNDSCILEADNMFRRWEVQVKNLLHEGQNSLIVIFSPPDTINTEKAASLPYRLPDNRVFTRKAPYQFGWDWGPEFVTCGIWKDVSLQAWDNLRIERLHVGYGGIDENPLPLKVQLVINSDREQYARVRVFHEESGRRIGFDKMKLKSGMNHVSIDAALEDPALWWPAGLGEQELSTIRVEVNAHGARDTETARLGIRDVELIREPDEFGESFYFVINGMPVFMKGANYIPQDNFLSRVDSTRYRRLIESVKEANINMLRVWGGGIYENDLFYELCDENGILLWQDFMFACAMYPGDTAFIENVREEVADNVSRLSNHPSIILWCGNNEIDEGWHNWGWQKQLGYSPADSAAVWQAYEKVFHETIPVTLRSIAPGAIYHPSSPMTGWGRAEAYEKGDVHYWGVWWGEEPFGRYHEKVGRFVSEYGFQGMPHMAAIRSFGGHTAAGPDHAVLEAHQKHPRGTELIRTYMEREYHLPDKFEDYVYLSQVLQAEGMGQAFYTHRISQPYCMGTLYWQLNDCWPVTSWSGLDYDGRWKALHYHVKRAYAPLMVRSFSDDKGLHVFAVNDHPQGVEAGLNCALLSFTGDTLFFHKETVFLPPQSNQRVFFSGEVPEGSGGHVFTAELSGEEGVIGKDFHYFAPTKQMQLHDPGIRHSVEDTPAGVVVVLKATTLARQVFLSVDEGDGRFSDNFFDMSAGETRKVIYTGGATAGDLNRKLNIKSIYETY